MSHLPAKLLGMISHSTPSSPPGQHCWHCTSYVALVYGGTAARCMRDGIVSIQVAPATGCAFWMRETGADDEPGAPVVGVEHRWATARMPRPAGLRGV